ncbi:MAG: alpha-L-fucosidase [Verrucomicrobiae bacterium]|nr:alpha-L-fucosidase [Verrucomicrobiae bacterium]
MEPSVDWFVRARYGLFVHYGLYSLLGRGEWVRNREQIPADDYAALAHQFTAERFDADAIADLAVRAGMRYVCFTTMHHDGFRLYDTQLSNFKSRRDLTGEIVTACRRRGLRVALYHSLNNWHDQPDAVAALEDTSARDQFLANTFARLRELVTRYNPIDVMWYDGWWPFDATGWRATEMNAMIREIQPHILFNGRNGLPGDFATPEGHLTAPRPWRPWEACVTHNQSWGYHAGDHDWKRPTEIIDMLARCAAGRGNLLLNIGPRGDGSLPEASVKVLTAVGDWLRRGGAEAIFDTDLFQFDPHVRGEHRADWTHHGPLTAKGRNLYWLMRRWPGTECALAGLECRVQRITELCTGQVISFEQRNGRVQLRGLPAVAPDFLCPVLRLECDRPPVLYLTGGMRTPRVPHPHYDPVKPDLLY